MLLVALVPFAPLAVFAWWGYHDEVARIEQEIRASNRHIALLGGHYLETVVHQAREEISVYGDISSKRLPPALTGVEWELVGGDGVIIQSQISPDRVGRQCTYAELFPAAGAPALSVVGPWIESAPPTVLVVGAATDGGRLVAMLDPIELHAELQAWTPEGGDRHLYVVESSGQLLFYSDLGLPRASADLASNPPIRHFVNGNEGDLRYTSVISGKQRLGTVRRLENIDWGIIVSADVGSRLIGLRSRTSWLVWSIVFAVAAATVIFAVTSRQLVRPLIEIGRALRDPLRDPKAPLEISPSYRKVRQYDHLVAAIDELGAEIAAVERELVQAEKASLLGQLASGLAHEMGTPLNVITGNAEYLLRKTGAGDPAQPALELIVKQGQRIAAMIRRLLDVSRPADARLVAVSLAPLVRQSLEIVPGLHPKVEVRCDLDDDVPQVLADPKLLEHALMNLILNACQAMPDGGRLSVVTGVGSMVDRGAPQIALMVGDNGCGITAGDLPRIFEPFFTTKAHGEGTGLGLSIVDRIVRQHGGRIEVTSAPNRGTVVVVWLRSAAESTTADRRPSEASDGAARI